ncbi:hypothetical protein M0R45_033604 [Rubus argutus]|uniref:RING-type E3 ubiquitin transferase n=1 Tax=Rubus argutus TaxID=59490 RepID=A0AAW1WPR0_RUBAR
MSSVPTEKHYYFSRAFQRGVREPFPPGEEDWLAVDFFLVKQSRCWYDPAPTTTDDISCEISLSGRSTAILFSSDNHRRGYTDLMSSYISAVGVPREEHPPILEKLFQVIEAAVPERRIMVLMADVTVRFFGSTDEMCSEVYVLHDIDYHGINDMVTWESFETQRISFVPATRSSIESLNKVILDSLEEATIKQNSPCAICMDDFAQGGVDQLITPLPCAHHYHLDCIIPWLKTSHMCPMCRYPMPRVEEAGPSNP